tara:strand:- start:2053 stop:2286 length:234 start_codon:yes stop_codon:yes gene_type:complete
MAMFKGPLYGAKESQAKKVAARKDDASSAKAITSGAKKKPVVKPVKPVVKPVPMPPTQPPPDRVPKDPKPKPEKLGK